MNDAQPVLDYAESDATRRGWEERPERIFIWIALAVAVITMVLPLTIGTGRGIVNPIRILGCLVAVAGLMAYALARLWQDRESGKLRKLVFGGCLFVSVAAFSYGHWSGWGDHWRPMSWRFAYWQGMLVWAGTIALAIAYAGLDRLLRTICSRGHAAEDGALRQRDISLPR